MLVTGRPLIVLGIVTVTAGTGVSGDGDRAVIGRVIELGLHHGGQRQQQKQQSSLAAQAVLKRAATCWEVVLNGASFHDFGVVRNHGERDGRNGRGNSSSWDR